MGGWRVGVAVVVALVAAVVVPGVAAAQEPAGVTAQIAGADFGSSDPTQFPNVRRIGVTAGGRTLVVHGKHADGVQLTWSNDGASWSRGTRGAVADGRLLPGQNSGDRPASLVIAEVGGVEHAWVFMAGHDAAANTALWGRRLSGLDHPDGPSVGPLQVLSAGPAQSKPDAAVEIAPDGTARIAVVWLRAVQGGYRLAARWVSDLATDAVSLDAATEFVFYEGTQGSRHGTLIESPDGLAFVGRASPTETDGTMRFWRRSRTAALGQWTRGGDGPGVDSTGYPSGVWADGRWMVASQRSTVNQNLRLVHWNATGSSATRITTPDGYLQPSIAAAPDGTAVIVVRRASDGRVVSWRYEPGSGWDFTDRVVLTGGQPYRWPNLDRRIRQDQLRFVVGSPGISVNHSSVFFRQVSLGGEPGPVAPSVTITSGPDELSSVRTATFVFSSNTPGATFQCQLDGGAWQSCTSPRQVTVTSDGDHSFRVRATANGVTSAPVSYDWRVVTTTTPPPPPPPVVFSDVVSGSTHEANIYKLAARGVTLGCGGDRFCPTDPVTRAQMATFLVRALELAPGSPAPPFSDVAAGSTHARSIDAMRREQITLGCGGSRYCPTDDVPRQQMASFLQRALGYEPGSASPPFSDVAPGSTHARAIDAVRREGVTVGCGGSRFCPTDSVTRAQMATFLVRALGW